MGCGDTSLFAAPRKEVMKGRLGIRGHPQLPKSQRPASVGYINLGWGRGCRNGGIEEEKQKDKGQTNKKDTQTITRQLPTPQNSDSVSHTILPHL